MRRALLATLVLAAGCTLRPPPDVSRFYTLTAESSDGSMPAASGQVIGLGPVDIPGYLDRTHLVTRVEANEIRVEDGARWAEPLRDGIARALQQDLRAASGARVILFPWPPAARPDVAVTVDVLRFEPGPGDRAEVAARWVVRGRDGRVLATRESHVAQPVEGNGQAGAVAALSRGLAALAREIADALRTAER